IPFWSRTMASSFCGVAWLTRFPVTSENVLAPVGVIWKSICQPVCPVVLNTAVALEIASPGTSTLLSLYLVAPSWLKNVTGLLASACGEQLAGWGVPAVGAHVTGVVLNDESLVGIAWITWRCSNRAVVPM